MKLRLYTHENCPACKRMEPIYEKLAEVYAMEVIDPTTDEGAERAWKDHVMSSPTLLIMNDEEIVFNSIVGAKREVDVRMLIDRCKEMM